MTWYLLLYIGCINVRAKNKIKHLFNKIGERRTGNIKKKKICEDMFCQNKIQNQ